MTVAALYEMECIASSHLHPCGFHVKLGWKYWWRRAYCQENIAMGFILLDSTVVNHPYERFLLNFFSGSGT
jgi:hypothetical protein